MTWDESKHPRDEKGQFTYSDGSDTGNDSENDTQALKGRIEKTESRKSPADILYRDSKIKAEKNRQEAEYKSKLLDILGNKAKPTDVLYGTTKELEEKVKEYGLKDKLKGTIIGGASGIRLGSSDEEVPTGFGTSIYMSSIDENKDNHQYMTPIEEMYKRRKGYSEIWEGDKNFKSAMVRMFNREGEYSNNKYDLGGETNLGITDKTLGDYKKKHPEFKDVNINNITKDQASKIYYDEYWKKSGADKIKDKDLAYVHFDATVNHGLGNSRKFLEQSGGDFNKYIEIRRKFYNDIVKNKPKQKNNIRGWMNRLKELEENRGNLF